MAWAVKRDLSARKTRKYKRGWLEAIFNNTPSKPGRKNSKRDVSRRSESRYRSVRENDSVYNDLLSGNFSEENMTYLSDPPPSIKDTKKPTRTKSQELYKKLMVDNAGDRRYRRSYQRSSKETMKRKKSGERALKRDLIRKSMEKERSPINRRTPGRDKFKSNSDFNQDTPKYYERSPKQELLKKDKTSKSETKLPNKISEKVNLSKQNRTSARTASISSSYYTSSSSYDSDSLSSKKSDSYDYDYSSNYSYSSGKDSASVVSFEENQVTYDTAVLKAFS